MGLISPVRLGRVLAGALTVILFSAGTAGCDSGGSEQSRPIEHDDRLSASILDLAEAGKGERLAALTEFDWDAVYLYYEGASADDITDDVGAELEMNEYYDSAGALMVFVRDDDVVRAISAPELVSWDGSNRFPSDVRLVPSRPGTSSGLSLQEPAR